MTEYRDITPNPRILRALGDIPFQPFQCLAELIDNSVDAFAEVARAGGGPGERKVLIAWSGDGVPARDKSVEIVDAGPGMTLDQIQNAARAGYSSNDPIHNLGLFGMGFNIATAKLGENTRLLSTRPGDPEWVGIEIDFPELIRSKAFRVRVVREPKTDPGGHGTRIAVSKLRGDTYVQLRDKEVVIRQRLENLYSTLLEKNDLEVQVQGRKLNPRRHCVWGESRFVSRDGTAIPAVIQIDRDLGVVLFDVERHRYLTRDEEADARESETSSGSLPSGVVERRKRLHGWIGIQRYADPNDFGIDFVRNGRKILISDKSLFNYENPMTGTSILEYPVELGTTVGGRIVGEINVDYMIPTYQKNDFDRTDMSWNETVEALRGVGPLLPKTRKAMGFTDKNTSPIGLLANAYRRTDQGTKCLFVERSLSREYTGSFRRGETRYQDDTEWWKAAQEADRAAATGGAATAPEVDTGAVPSDNPDDYAPPGADAEGVVTPPAPVPVAPSAPALPTSTLDELKRNSRHMTSLSGPYAHGSFPPLQVKVWELSTGTIQSSGESAACAFFIDGIECDFFFNPRHPLLAQYPVEPRHLLAVYMAEKFKARDRMPDIGRVYGEIVQRRMPDSRIDKAGLQERATEVLDRLREMIAERLSHRRKDLVECIHESQGEVEETVTSMLSGIGSRLVIDFQDKLETGYDALQYVPHRTLLRIIDRFPEDLFDNKVFKSPYSALSLPDTQATERLRGESKDRIVGYLKDALWVISKTTGVSALGRMKDELSRCAHSINFLAQEIAD